MTSYAWTGPNSFSSGIQAPSIVGVTTAASGTYSLTVTNSNGCSASATTAVTINALPVPNPSSNTPKCVGTTLAFNSVAGMTSYAWTGPNSFSSGIQAPSIIGVTTAASGTYSLTVTNSNGCSASATTAVTINSLPVPNPSSDSPKCIGTTLAFNSVAGMITYAWTGPNSFSSGIQSPSIIGVTSAASGTYSLTVTNSNGCSASATTAVTINTLPLPNPSSDSPKCVGTTLAFNSVTGMTTYAWTGPNSFSSNIQAPSIIGVTTAASGTYSLTVTNSNGCSASATTAVTINALPVPNPSSDSPKCVGTTLAFNSVAGMTTYAWTGPNSFSSGIQAPLIIGVTTAESGTYSLSVTNANGCSASATTAVTINALPVPNPSSDSPKCVGTTLAFNSVSGMTTYAWTGPNSFSSGIQAPSIIGVTTAANGIYSLTVTNSNGCSASATTAVTINLLPVRVVGSNSPICSGTTLNLNAGGGATYAWTGPNSFSSTDQNPSILTATTANSGTYSVTIITALGCSTSATVAATMFVLPNPTISSNSPICAGTTLNLTAESGATVYAWTGPNSFSSGLQNPTIPNSVGANSGIYSITVTNSNGCTSTATISVTVNEVIATASNTGPYQVGNQIQLNATGGTSYAWTGPNNFTSSIPNSSINNSLEINGGVYSVVVTRGLCSTTAITTVVVTGIDPCIQILEYMYVKAGSSFQTLFPLSNGQVIAQANYPTSIKVKPLCNTIPIESVEMRIVGPFVDWTILQSYQHFALFDNVDDMFNGQVFAPGTYTLTVKGFAQKFGYGGTTYGPVVTTFTVVGNSPTVSMPNLTGSEFCAGSNVSVGFATSGTFGVNNQFIIMLSDSSGSFNNNPQIIGSTTVVGTNPYPIPASVTGGDKYKIQVVSTEPATGNYTLGPIKIHPVNLNLVSPTNDFGIATTTKKAVEAITATNKINSTAKIGYQAGKSILLRPGFESRSGSVFKAEIGGCSN